MSSINNLIPQFQGIVSTSAAHRLMYATDASVYKEVPLGVAVPISQNDLFLLVDYAVKNKVTIIPRGAGTSLGGQVVGNGLVIDFTHLNKIIEFNEQEQWVDVEPGVVLDELNLFLKPFGLFFGPETSTSSRCTIGGMVGNNSCGARSMVYGSTRDHLLEVEGFLSSGEKVCFGSINPQQLEAKKVLPSHEGGIYEGILSLLSDSNTRNSLLDAFPHPSIHRRNSGYALDLVALSNPFNKDGLPLNLAKLIAGSEGTLMVLSRIRLNLVPLPPKHTLLLVAHFNSLYDALEANTQLVGLMPRAIELMDKTILDLTKSNIEQNNNRFFLQGDPQALLIVELGEMSQEDLEKRADLFTHQLHHDKAYAVVSLANSDMAKVWALRKAGLGVLSNMEGDAKPVSVIEDCAVRVEDLPNFCRDISAMLLKYGKECVFHGHAGSGELHLRPVLNLKESADVALFHEIALDAAHIVKRYRGSFSGEHGDGRVRGEFLPFLVGEENYKLFESIKVLFDPNNLFNPNKIVATPPMNSFLRYRAPQEREQPINHSLLQIAERCNGSADCLKSSLIGGAMCPSYQATKNEFLSPRGRANLIREYLLNSDNATKVALDDVVQSLEICLSCKACKSECPSNVDISALKVDLLHLYHLQHGVKLRDRLFMNFGNLSNIASRVPRLYNWAIKRSAFKLIAEKLIGISSKRNLPLIAVSPFQKRLKKRDSVASKNGKKILLLNDEFTNYYNSDVAEMALQFFERLGYSVVVYSVSDSARTHLSKGALEKANEVINSMLVEIALCWEDEMTFVGLEPSTILTFRDEALRLANTDNKIFAEKLANCTFTFEEFVAQQMESQTIDATHFTLEAKKILFHGHCYQKAIGKPGVIKKVLSLPKNYTVEEINSGCCGMGGSFGYEVEHYDLSVAIAELVLLPKIRLSKIDSTVVTSGISCKHQIQELSGIKVKHPVEILYNALIK